MLSLIRGLKAFKPLSFTLARTIFASDDQFLNAADKYLRVSGTLTHIIEYPRPAR